jgi:hypothetical protein
VVCFLSHPKELHLPVLGSAPRPHVSSRYHSSAEHSAIASAPGIPRAMDISAVSTTSEQL